MMARFYLERLDNDIFLTKIPFNILASKVHFLQGLYSLF